MRLTPFMRLYFGNKKETHYEITYNGYLTREIIVRLLRQLADNLEKDAPR
jgi:hypothetical protein